MKKIVSIVIVIAVIGTAVLVFTKQHGNSKGADSSTSPVIKSEATKENIAEISQYKYTQRYADTSNHFSFNYPADFTITNLPADNGATAILVQSIPKHVGVQILVTPYTDTEVDMTADIIHASIPDIEIHDSQPVNVRPTRKGLAFISDNKSFGGQSREVWFIFGGNLYQISTYLELDDFLKGIFATWQFK